MQQEVTIFWLRRDMRWADNTALYHALLSPFPVLPVFILDTNILDSLSDKTDRRIGFILQQLTKLQEEITRYGSSLYVLHATPVQAFKKLLSTFAVKEVFTNHDYEPYARSRDAEIAALLSQHNIGFHSFKDQVIFEKDEVMKDNGTPYTVFTPYSKRWKEKLAQHPTAFHASDRHWDHFLKTKPMPIPTAASIGFDPKPYSAPPLVADDALINHYTATRDFPGINGTSMLSVHLRFGTVSIRQLVQQALRLNETYLNELIWREFYMMILWHFPHVVQRSFKPEYDAVQWRNNEKEIAAWKNGITGYPIVDAGMRQLNQTGYMHNRVRMITASFLTKHLLADWRIGEAYFAEKLNDFDLSANNGGWQWAAGCGCDAAPYFRIFNPYLQTQKFDPDHVYIKRWVPELETLHYPLPIVQHETARARCLETYKKALAIH